MMLHIDGSKHQWFGDGYYHDLIVVMDDATNKIYYAQLVAEESTFTVMAALREVIEKEGLFCSLYCDRARHFFLTPKAGEAVAAKHLRKWAESVRVEYSAHPSLFTASAWSRRA